MTETPSTARQLDQPSARDRKGFTLTEVLMSVFILSMVMTGVYGAFIACNKLWYSTSLDCASSNRGSMAVERFVYGDGWTPGLRAAFSDSISLAQTGSSWTLTYSTPDTTNNYFAYISTNQTLVFSSQGAAAPHAIARNVASATINTNSSGASLSLQIVMAEGMFTSTNNFNTFVCYRN